MITVRGLLFTKGEERNCGYLLEKSRQRFHLALLHQLFGRLFDLSRKSGKVSFRYFLSRKSIIVRVNTAIVKYRTYFLKTLVNPCRKGLTVPRRPNHAPVHPDQENMWDSVG